MGRRGLRPTSCDHKREDYYEDDIFCGMVYVGKRCIKCHDIEYPSPGPLELGVYQ